MRRLALAPIFLVGLFAGAWLVVSPWVVGFPAGAQGGWSASRWSAVWAGVVVVGISGAALVTTVGLAVADAPHRSQEPGQE